VHGDSSSKQEVMKFTSLVKGYLFILDYVFSFNMVAFEKMFF
jgi:hypothetical protein